MESHQPFPFHDWLDLCQSNTGNQSFCDFMCAVVLSFRKQCFAPVLSYLWLLESFCLFSNFGLWALGRGCDMDVSCGGALHWHFIFKLWSVLCWPLSTTQTSVISCESCTILKAGRYKLREPFDILFSRIIVVGLPLRPVRFPTTDYCTVSESSWLFL